jgi:hypothetical protein
MSQEQEYLPDGIKPKDQPVGPHLTPLSQEPGKPQPPTGPQKSKTLDQPPGPRSN